MKPIRLRLFLFPGNQPLYVGGSGEVLLATEKLVEELNSSTVPRTENNVDYLFGSEKELLAGPPIQQPQHQVKLRDHVCEAEVKIPAVVSDQIQKHIEDLQRLRLEEQQRLYRSKRDNLSRAKVSPLNVPEYGPMPVGYWPEKQTTSVGGEQSVYKVSQPTSAFQAPMTRPINQGYYGIQGVTPHEAHPVPPPVMVAPQIVQPQGPQRIAPLRCTEGINMVRPQWTAEQYPQVVYDGLVGRQNFSNGLGGQANLGPPRTQAATAPQYQGVAAGLLNQYIGKVVVPKSA